MKIYLVIILIVSNCYGIESKYINFIFNYNILWHTDFEDEYYFFPDFFRNNDQLSSQSIIFSGNRYKSRIEYDKLGRIVYFQESISANRLKEIKISYLLNNTIQLEIYHNYELFTISSFFIDTSVNQIIRKDIKRTEGDSMMLEYPYALCHDGLIISSYSTYYLFGKDFNLQEIGVIKENLNFCDSVNLTPYRKLTHQSDTTISEFNNSVYIKAYSHINLFHYNYYKIKLDDYTEIIKLGKNDSIPLAKIYYDENNLPNRIIRRNKDTINISYTKNEY
ncbi:MAG: hypothetical protein WC121_09665 [Candidatus Kapaibacterium sp.]